MKALIVGGGVAGLSTAIALRKVGVDVQVYERAPEIRDIGAGKSLWRNGLQALDWLSVAGEVTAAGSPIEEIRVLSWRGRVFHRIPVGKFGTSLAVERQDVLGPLANAVDAATVRTSARCVGFDQEAGGVTARFEDGSVAHGDLLVGSDGIFSTIRRGLFPGWSPVTRDTWHGVA